MTPDNIEFAGEKTVASCANDWPHPPWRVLSILVIAFVLAPAGAEAIDPITPNCKWQSSVDFQPCFQAAIQRASADNGTVLIPRGTWPLGQALNLASNVTLMGASGDATLIPAADNVSRPVLLRGNNINHGTIAGLRFDGGGSDFPNANPVVGFFHADRVTITGITVQHTRGIGLILQGGVTNSVVRGSQFMDLGNHWKTTRQRADRLPGVVFCCGSNARNRAADNNFRDIGLDALQMSDQSDFEALRNTFELENHQRDIVRSPDYPSAIFPMYSSGGLIQGNVITGAQGNGIDAPGLQSSVIELNTISLCGGAGIGIFLGYNKSTRSAHLKIRDNVILDNVQWGAPSVFKGGVTIAGGPAEDISIERNAVHDDQVGKTQAYGLMILKNAPVRDLVLKDNHFEGNRESEIFRQ